MLVLYPLNTGHETDKIVIIQTKLVTGVCLVRRQCQVEVQVLTFSKVKVLVLF